MKTRSERWFSRIAPCRGWIFSTYLICHAAFGQPPLSRSERANNVRKRDYFSQYGERTRKVLEALLDKYTDEGIENIEDIKVLQVNPLNRFGSPMEIVNVFGGKKQYMIALEKLAQQIYAA